MTKEIMEEKTKNLPAVKHSSGIKEFTKTPQGRSFAWISLTVFTISFFLLVAIRPTLITVAKLTREIKEKREADKKLDAKIDSLVSAQKILAKNSSKISLLEEAFPDNNKFPSLAYYFEATAQNHQAQISNFTFEKIVYSQNETARKKEKNPYLRINFSVSVEGEYQNLKNFIQAVENSRRIINIESAKFTKVNKEKTETETETQKSLALTISGYAFYEKE